MDIEGGENNPDSVEILEPENVRKFTFSPTIQENAPTVLSFENIRVRTMKGNKKVLLDDVSGCISGGLWAIMGASGSGKTTLLSTLSLRLDPSFMDIEGIIRLNGREYSKSILKSMAAYVMQDDLLHAELTVGETLAYAAKLRMGDSATAAEIENRQLEVLKLMGIEHCKDIIIGDTKKKGISGGERKRLCVAIELLNYPKLLFLDEPTSGLDSSTALDMVAALKQLADSGSCTVVCTIHQPQPKIFNLFDSLILMKRGKVVYQGSRAKTDRFIEMVGIPCPEDVNVADHLLELVKPGKDGAEEVDVNRTPPIDLTLGIEKPLFLHERATSWLRQYTVLCDRNLKQYYRRPDLMLMNLVCTILVAVFIGTGAWNHLGVEQSSTKTRTPSLFFCSVSQGIAASLQSINSFPGERAIMLRERAAGSYQMSSYYLARTSVDMMTQLWSPVLFSIIVYFNVGYQLLPSKFFLFVMFMIMDTMAATSLATAVTCLCLSVEMSTITLSCLFEMSRLYGGYFVSPLQLQGLSHWKFADALSYIKYTYIGVALNELHGLDFDCPSTGTCTYRTGEDYIASVGYDEYSIGLCAGALVALIVGFRLIGYLGLKYLKNK